MWMKVDDHLQLSHTTSECMISELKVLLAKYPAKQITLSGAATEISSWTTSTARFSTAVQAPLHDILKYGGGISQY